MVREVQPSPQLFLSLDLSIFESLLFNFLFTQTYSSSVELVIFVAFLQLMF